MAAVVAGFAAVAILVNALFMQSGPHPAPIFANKPAPVAVPLTGPAAALREPSADAKLEAARPRSDTVAEIQRELARHGFYDGAADGVYGPKTDAAIRDFEQAAGLRPSAEPNDMLLASIARSAIKAQPVAIQRNDPIAALLAPSAAHRRGAARAHRFRLRPGEADRRSTTPRPAPPSSASRRRGGGR